MESLVQLSAVLTLLTLPIMPMKSEAQDTYNFYFQKDKGPQTVIQGSQNVSQESEKNNETPEIQEENAAKVSSAAAGQTSAVFAQEEPENDESYFKVALGAATLQYNREMPGVIDHRHNGYAIGLEYHLNKYIGVGGEYILSQSNDRQHYNDRSTNKDAGSLGVIVTPIHINLFGYKAIEVSAIGGAMTVSDRDYSYVYLQNMAADYPTRMAYRIDAGTKIRPYYGARVTLNAAKQFNVAANLRYYDQSDVSAYQLSVTAGWKF